mgnify:CR=1 FL=1
MHAWKREFLDGGLKGLTNETKPSLKDMELQKNEQSEEIKKLGQNKYQ